MPETARQVVGAIEELAEDPAIGAPLEASKQAAWEAWLNQEDAAWLVVWAASANPRAAASLTALATFENLTRVLAGQTEQLETVRERRQQLAVFAHDVLGNPFRPVTITPGLLTWHDRTIPKLAQAAYDERELPSGHLDAKRLAILADALEEAGCTNEDVLAHLRGAGPHVHGQAEDQESARRGLGRDGPESASRAGCSWPVQTQESAQAYRRSPVWRAHPRRVRSL